MIKVNPDLCIGCGLCVRELPEVFEFNSDGIAEANNENYKPEMAEKLEESITSCPVSAISK